MFAKRLQKELVKVLTFSFAHPSRFSSKFEY
jgi:hypothetical protein